LLVESSKIEWVITETENLEEYQETGKIALTLVNFTVTPDCAELADFTNP
jgi:hypothetical protein